MEALLNTKDAALNAASAEKRALEADKRNLKDDLNKLNEISSQLKRKLQEETLGRLEAESSLQTLTDKLEFLITSHAEEKKKLQERCDELLAKSFQAQQEFEDKLATTVADLNAQDEEQLNSLKEDMEKTFKSKLEVLQQELQKTKNQMDKVTMERQENRNRIRDLSGKLVDQENKISDLGFQLAREQDSNIEKDREMAEIQKKLQEDQEECRKLHANIETLNREQAIYRNILEGEEKRLNMSPSPTRPLRRTPRSDRGTIIRQLQYQTPPGGKRPRTSISPGTPRVQGSPVRKIYITQKATASGRIITDEVDLEGKFVRLKNLSGEDQAMTNWCLNGQVGASSPSKYMFPKGFILKAGQTVTIWASSAGMTQTLPTDLVYQAINTWGTGDRQFSLINADGEEIAKRAVTCTEEFHGYAAVDDEHEDEDDDDDDDVDGGATLSTSGDYNLRSRTVISERGHSNQSTPAK